MKPLYAIFALLLLPSLAYGACDCGSTDAANPCTGQSISVTVTAGTPNGGTAYDGVYSWAFNSGGGDARCGQFANGDYWVAPASGQSTVTITGITSTSPGTLRADVDPTVESMGLLGTTEPAYGNYESDENIIPLLPETYSGINSLVAGLIRNQGTEGGCGTSSITGTGCISSYNVVTVLSSVPENAGSTVIRPNITGETKELLTWSDFDLTRIPSKSYLTGTDSTGLATIKRRWSHSIEIFALHNSVCSSDGYCSEGGRAFRSHTLIDDYGAGTAATWYNDLMYLFSDDHTTDAKKPALAAMLSYGLDLYHAMYDAPVGTDRHWGTGATQHPGKFMPPVLLAALLTDTTYANTLKTASEHLMDSVYNGPLELAQVHDGTNGPVWGDIPGQSGVNFTGEYWGNLMASQCYDNAPEMETWDYYIPGEWKTFNLPIGTLHTGSGLYFVFWSVADEAGEGDWKIKNVELDGVPINFNSITLNNYHTATASGTITDSGATYNIAAGQTVKKISTNTYTVNSNSILSFEMYQDVRGASHGIGFETNTTYNDGDKMVQVSGTWGESIMFQKGCTPALGPKTMYDFHGYIDGPPNKPGTSYMASSLGVQRSMVATMSLMPEVCEIVNYEPLLEYVDRVHSDGVKADNDPCVTPDSREDFENCDPYRNTGCDYYGVTWGPVTPTSKTSECITTVTAPYTNAGRFDWVDGSTFTAAYTSPQVETNWETIRSESTCGEEGTSASSLGTVLLGQ